MRLFLLLLILLLFPAMAQSQSAQPEVRLFQSFFLDGSQVGQVYGDVGIGFNDYDNLNITSVGGHLGFPIGTSFEGGIMLNYLSFNPSFGPNRDGINDLTLTGRYLASGGRSPISVGGYLTLPIGDEEIGGGDVNLGVFGAIRHAANERLAITGVLGIDFFERGDDYDGSLRLGGGLIYRTGPGWRLVGELTFLTEPDYALLTVGMDHAVSGSLRIRPGLGVGLDDGAPDFALLFGLLFL